MVESTSSHRKSSAMDRRRLAMSRLSVKRKQRLTIISIAMAVAVVLSVFLVSYVVLFVLPPRELVIRVNDVEYTRGDLVEQVRIRQKSADFMGQNFDATTVIFQTLQAMVEVEIISQTAPSVNIIIEEEDVDSEIEKIMSPAEHMRLGKSQSQIKRETDEKYASYLNTVQISEEKHRAMVRNALMRSEFKQYIGESVPLVAEQVHLYRILMPNDGEIDIMKVKFDDAVGGSKTPGDLGDAYLEIVREFSMDSPETVRKGGEIGWVAKGVLAKYDYHFFDLSPGELSDPVQDLENSNQTYFFMISDRDPARQLSFGVMEELKVKALQEWVNGKRKEHDVYAVFNSEIYDWVFEQLRITSTAPTPTPNPYGHMFN